MPNTITQVANACKVTKKIIRFSLLSPVHTILLILEPPQLGSIGLPKLNFSAYYNYYCCITVSLARAPVLSTLTPDPVLV